MKPRRKNTFPISPRNLDAYQLSLELVKKLTPRLTQFDRALAAQAKRAAPSICLNTAEALARKGRDRVHLLSIALGSAREVRAIIDVARASEMISQATAAELDKLGDRICATLFRLRECG